MRTSQHLSASSELNFNSLSRSLPGNGIFVIAAASLPSCRIESMLHVHPQYCLCCSAQSLPWPASHKITCLPRINEPTFSLFRRWYRLVSSPGSLLGMRTCAYFRIVIPPLFHQIICSSYFVHWTPGYAAIFILFLYVVLCDDRRGAHQTGFYALILPQILSPPATEKEGIARHSMAICLGGLCWKYVNPGVIMSS